jgi:hypothetical protein
MDPMDRHSVIYFPLSSPDASIRLLRIFREKGSSIITGQLEAFPLDPVNCPAFIAVSYAWCEKVYPRGPQSPNRLPRIGIKAVRGKTKPLTKLRPKPQVSAAFHCSSIGIDAN